MFLAGTSHWLPPLKSSPRLRPCTLKEMIVMMIAIVEMPMPHHLRPTKSMLVSP
jgi:hypothetical protein